MASSRGTTDSPTPRPHLVVLLGYRNHPDGNLFAATKARCDLALAQAIAHPGSIVIPTGAFGANFNQSPRAHGALLTEYLVNEGLSRERILPFTRTSRTLEDAFAVRRQAVDLRASGLTVVTSAFHENRCRFLFGRVLTDFPIEFVNAEVPPSERTDEAKEVKNDIQNESQKLAAEMRGWLELPLYGPSETQKSFPEQIYTNASDEQQTYDKISYLLISGAFISFAAPYTLSNRETVPMIVGQLLSIFLMLALFVLYLRVAGWANRARQLMYLIEAQWGVPGFSFDFLHGERPAVPRAFGFVRMFSAIIGCLVIAQIAAGGWTYWNVMHPSKSVAATQVPPPPSKFDASRVAEDAITPNASLSASGAPSAAGKLISP